MEHTTKVGWTVQDRITGFKGIVTSRTEYLFGCIRVGVLPTKLDKDGKTIEPHVFDEPQLKIISRRSIIKPQQGTGGPRSVPSAKGINKK